MAAALANIGIDTSVPFYFGRQHFMIDNMVGGIGGEGGSISLKHFSTVVRPRNGIGGIGQYWRR